MSIPQNLSNIRAAIPHGVMLVAVSKTVEETRLLEAIEAGQRVFGENYVQEAKAKWPVIKSRFPDIRLNLIGHLQSNKADDAVMLFERIDTLDRISLADALAKAMQKKNRHVPCLIEVNIGAEPQKAGCAVEAVPALLAHARGLGIKIEGLMAIPPAGEEAQPYFKKLAVLAKTLGLSVISMGMSQDYETAIACGATEVRIGSGIFGARQTKE